METPHPAPTPSEPTLAESDHTVWTEGLAGLDGSSSAESAEQPQQELFQAIPQRKKGNYGAQLIALVLFTLLIITLSIVIIIITVRTRSQARDEIHQRSIEFSPNSFVRESRAGNAELLKLFIEAGADPNTMNYGGWTPLMAATAHGHLNVFQTLLQAGAKLNSQANKRFEQNALSQQLSDSTLPAQSALVQKNCLLSSSPLLVIAATFGNIEIITHLLTLGLEVNEKTATNWTALMCALAANQKAATVSLIRSGAEINSTAEFTPLMAAINSENPELLQLLLDQKADINATNKAGQNALILETLAPRKNSTVAEMLINAGVNLTLKDFSGKGPLTYAVINKNTKLVELFLQKDSSLALEQDAEGNTPLMLAAKYGHEDIAELLIAYSGNLNTKNFKGETAWQIAEAYEREKLVLKLHPEFQLFAKILKKDIAGIKEITNLGANLNAQDSQGISPLLSALSNGRPYMTRILLSTGTNPKFLAESSGKPVRLSNQALTKKVRAYENISSILKRSQLSEEEEDALIPSETGIIAEAVNAVSNKNSETPSKAMLHTLSHTNSKIVETLLQAGASPNLVDSDGNSPLLYAIQSGTTDDVKTLVERGANPFQQNSSGITPLFLAVSLKKTEMVEAILNAPNKQNLPVQSTAAQKVLLAAVETGQVQTIRFLLDAGVSPEVEDSSGRRAVLLSAARGDITIAELLHNHGAKLSADDPAVATVMRRAREQKQRKVLNFLESVVK